MKYDTLEEALKSVSENESLWKWMPIFCLETEEEKAIVKEYIENHDGIDSNDVALLGLSIKWKREGTHLELMNELGL